MELLQFWNVVAVPAIMGVQVLYTVVSNRSRASKEELDQIRKEGSKRDERLQNHSDRMTRLEQEVKNMPTDNHIAALTAELSKLNRELGEMSGGFTALQRQVGNIETWLRDK